MNEGQALVETQRELRDMEARAERAEHELNEWERGDVGQANRLMADRCVNAEHIARDAVARAEKAEAALAGPESPLAERMRHRAIAAEAALAAARDEIASLKQDVETYSAAHDAAAMLLRDSEDRLATARAVMAEEARRAAKHSIESHRARYGFPHEIQQHIENHIRALAPLPAGLVVLSVEVVARVRMVVRTGRWGTCVACPRLDGEVRPERCAFTERYDHNLPTDNLLAALDAAGGATK